MPDPARQGASPLWGQSGQCRGGDSAPLPPLQKNKAKPVTSPKASRREDKKAKNIQKRKREHHQLSFPEQVTAPQSHRVPTGSPFLHSVWLLLTKFSQGSKIHSRLALTPSWDSPHAAQPDKRSLPRGQGPLALLWLRVLSASSPGHAGDTQTSVPQAVVSTALHPSLRWSQKSQGLRDSPAALPHACPRPRAASRLPVGPFAHLSANP